MSRVVEQLESRAAVRGRQKAALLLASSDGWRRQEGMQTAYEDAARTVRDAVPPEDWARLRRLAKTFEEESAEFADHPKPELVWLDSSTSVEDLIEDAAALTRVLAAFATDKDES